MADAPDLHQIEYRHDQTNDLSPVASSMPSRESLAAWDSRIRAWVRHPHADMLSESACYQQFPNGQAALAWRYWDERAASRDDGTLGRPLVSRVFLGPASVLTSQVALASCRAGLSAEMVGLLPGQVPVGSELPMVSGSALIAMTRDMSRGLDQASAAQAGLQAVVAAALAEPGVPLAISVQDVLIQAPLQECVQCLLLWGLRRITGPLLGPGGRGWSFSTFELPLGQMDPTSLPGIVFRETQDGIKAPPARWRREARVRPFEDAALGDETPYAGLIERAGWLIAEYRQRGGDGLEQFITSCGGAGSFTTRLAQVSEALLGAHQPAVSGPGRVGRFLAAHSPAAAPKQDSPPEQDSAPARLPVAASALATPVEAGPGPQAPPPGTARAGGSELVSPPPQAAQPDPARAKAPQPEVSHVAPAQVQPDSPWFDGAGFSDPRSPEEPQYPEEPQHPDEEPQYPEQPRYQEPAAAPASGLPSVDPASFARGPAVADPGRTTGRHRGESRNAGSGRPPLPVDPLAPSRAGQQAAPLILPGRGGPPANTPPALGGERAAPRGNQESVSSMLKRLELIGEDQALFESILDGIHRASVLTPEERRRSWGVISDRAWHTNVTRNNGFRSGDLTIIFSLVVIPGLVPYAPANVIAKWALDAPPPMIQGLLAAATRAGAGMPETVMQSLEPALAYRWMTEHYMPEYWDDSRLVRPDPGLARRGDGSRPGWLRRLFGLGDAGAR
jgi:hypothetical protein